MEHKTKINLHWRNKFYELNIKKPYFEKNIVLRAFKGLDLLDDKAKPILFYTYGSNKAIDGYEPEDGFFETVFGGNIEFVVQRELSSRGIGLYVELKHPEIPLVIWINNEESRIFISGT